MKIEENFGNVVRSGVVDKIACSVSVNAFSFKLLSRVYENPIKAILRELGSNAVDSHNRAGNTNPFSVSLPGPFSNMFKVRDYGTGMTPEVIRDVYANWMSSDKRSSNTEVGCFGIGSKSPFSYTNSFNITSYVDKKVYMYTLCYNESGIPELQHYGSFLTDEPNGVEISFAVKESDYKEFRNVANNVYAYFDIKPLIDGGANEAKHEVLMAGDRWESIRSDNYGIVFVMGGVPYPLNSWKVENPFQHKLNKTQLLIRVPIGRIDITPSREYAEYTDKTVDSMKSELRRVFDEMTKQVVEEIDNLPSDLSDWSYYSQKERIIRNYHDSGIRSVKNEDLKRQSMIYPVKIRPSGLSNENQFSVRQIITYRQVSKGIKEAFDNEISVLPGGFPSHLDRAWYLFSDGRELKSSLVRKLKNYVATTGSSIHIIVPNPGQTEKDILDYIGANADEFKFIGFDDLPEVPRAERKSYARLPKNLTKVKVLRNKHWHEEVLDLSVGQYVLFDSIRDISRHNTGCVEEVCGMVGRTAIALVNKNKSIAGVDFVRYDVKNMVKKYLLSHDGLLEKWGEYHFLQNHSVVSHSNLISGLGEDHPIVQLGKKKEACRKPDLYQRWHHVLEEELELEENKHLDSYKFLVDGRYNGISTYDTSNYIRLVKLVDRYESENK